MTIPFTFPAAPHRRRHGPAGYADYESYRPWLRDEFEFCCVFCLARETWGPFRGQYAIDHFVPAVLAPSEATSYSNLLYCCVTCNGVKGDHQVPDPLTALLDSAVRCGPDGVIRAETTEAGRLLAALDLNDPRRVEFRALWIAVVSLAERFDPVLHCRLLAYPADLPDLATLKPPAGNTRPEGVAESYSARRARGELPETY